MIRGVLLASLIAVASSATAQDEPTIRAGDTVRVWFHGASVPPRAGLVTSLRGDSLVLQRIPSLHAIAFSPAVTLSGARRIDVARGRRAKRGPFAATVAVGTLVGLGAGIALARQDPCDTCLARFDFVRIGSLAGAGVGFLLGQRLFREPSWHPAWPTTALADAQRLGRDVREGVPPITPDSFARIRPGQVLRVWTSDSLALEGAFAGVTPQSLRVQLGQRADSVPLSLVDVVWLRRTHTGKAATIGLLTGLVPVALLGGLLCWDSDQCDDVGTVALVAGSLGAVIGAVVGSLRPSYEVRYSRMR